MQQGGDELMKCPGLDHLEKNKKESRSMKRALTSEIKPDGLDWIIRSGTSSRSRRPPGLDHPGKSGGLAPLTGSSRADRLTVQEMGPAVGAEVGPVIRV